MPIDLKRYEQLKQRADDARRRADKAEGALEKLMEELERDFGYTTLAEAERKLVGLEKEAEAAERDFGKKLEAFEDKWADVLDTD
jgi:predicted  nucleic acid-binding Zn-ribbon protein